MRCLFRMLAACALAVGLAHAGAGKAAACIRFDHAAEVRLIDHAIASPETPVAKRVELKTLRHTMRLNRGTQSEQLIAYHLAVTQAFKLLGKDRIVLRDLPSKPDRRAQAAAAGGCG